MVFEVIEKEENTDKGYGRDYGAKHTVRATYKHPKGIVFKHVHADGKDYEDVYRHETVTIGDMEIQYSYDWGNYFISENVRVMCSGKQVSYAEQEYGAVDPLKTKTEHREEGLQIIKQLGEDFGLLPSEFINKLSSTFDIKLDVLKLFLS